MHSLCHRLCRCHRSFDSASNPNHLPQPSLFLERCTCRFCIFSVRNGGNATSHEKCVLFFHCPLGDPNTVWGFLSKRTTITYYNYSKLQTPPCCCCCCCCWWCCCCCCCHSDAFEISQQFFFPHSSCHSSGSVQAMPISIIFQYSKFVCLRWVIPTSCVSIYICSMFQWWRCNQTHES